VINYLSGILESKSQHTITIDSNGIGYEAVVALSTLSNLPETGSQIKIYIVESVSGMYGGIVYLYGFLTKEEREMYLLIKDEVPGTGAKKAMEYIDKISKSFADFKAAIISKNSSVLENIFGFTKKTSDKLITALKDKIVCVNVLDNEKLEHINLNENNTICEAIAGLIALGYTNLQAKNAVNKAYKENENMKIEDLIKKALQEL
jgi:Holliday junction DNA helicase RuvA